MGERKPAWLRLIAPDRNPQKLTPVKCSGCGRWCIEQRGATQWDKWDAGIITGDDLTVAIILNRTHCWESSPSYPPRSLDSGQAARLNPNPLAGAIDNWNHMQERHTKGI